MNIEILLDFLSNHTAFAYFILFLGSFLETIFILSFFIPGEAFFISGSVLAGMGYLNIWLVVFLLLAGGILGDNVSFILGKKYGDSFFKYFEKKPFLKKILNEKALKKGENYFKKYGKFSIFLARFFGPVSWVFPFFAGKFKIKHLTFVKYNTPGVILGIGQFIAIGYFGGKHYEDLLVIFSKYMFVILFLVISAFFIYYYLKKHKYIKVIKENFRKDKKYLIKFTIKKFSWIVTIISVIFFSFLIIIFFNENSVHNIYFQNNISKNNINIDNFDKTFLNNCNNLKTYYKDNSKNSIQPINIILYSYQKIEDILKEKWVKNKIFGKDEIKFKEYIKLFINKTPPMSNVYFLDNSQNFAFQNKSESFISREHIRFWNFKSKKEEYKNAYVASISKDNGISFQFYNKFITPVHSINQNVDLSRELFKNFLEKTGNFNCKYNNITCQVKKFTKNIDEQNYFTDGKILECYEK